MASENIEIGDRVRDRLTGFEGIASGKTEYLNGCRQYLISPEKVKDTGEAIKGVWIDEQTIEVKKKAVFANPFPATSVAVRATAGGPPSHERRT